MDTYNIYHKKLSCDKCRALGFENPMDALMNGSRENILYVATIQPNKKEPHGDYLTTIDVDPCSTSYSEIIHRTFTNNPGDELRNFGWNACSNCPIVDYNCEIKPKRDKLVMPGVNSNRVYIVDVGSNPCKPTIIKTIDGYELKKRNASAPHIPRCLPDGTVMISILGDAEGNARSDYVVLNKDFEYISSWVRGPERASVGYDFWYQPKFNVMVATEWAAPNLFRRQLQLSDLEDLTNVGRRINFYKWSTHDLFQSVDLGSEGFVPLAVRFLHDPDEPQGFVATALFSKVFHFKKITDSEEYEVKKVIDIPTKKVEGWLFEEMGGLTTDLVLSLDDKFLYLSNWFHGDVRQYNITDRENPKLVGQIFLGGLIQSDGNVNVIEDLELTEQPPPRFVKSRRIFGGPHTLQLSLDGKRLYVSTSMFSTIDQQFYPDMVKEGGVILQINCDIIKGGLKVNENFLVDFGKEPYGPTLPHEMRYPGGDCTSDIWLTDN